MILCFPILKLSDFDFATRSVVMIASAELLHPAGDNFPDNVGRAFTIFWAGRGTPMIPVEAIRISFERTESSCDSRKATDLQSSIPLGPVQALALPLLTTMARKVLELFSIFRHQVTVGETTLFVVKTPAAMAGTSEKISARSFC